MTVRDGARTIALIGPFPPFRGGIAHFTERVGQELMTVGHRLVPVSFSRLYPAWLFPGRSQFESDGDSGNMEVANRAELDSINPFSWGAAARAILRERIDAAVFMYWHPFFAMAYRGVARRLERAGIPMVAIVHNALPHERHPFDALLSRSFLQQCTAVATLSQSVEADVRGLAPGVPTTVIMHPPYDRFGASVSRTQARAELGLDPEDEILLFFGLVREYKGLDVLLRALGTLQAVRHRLHLLVAGEFYEDRGRYEALIRDMNLEGRVHITDRYVATPEVGRYFGAADAVVQPYRSATQSGIIQIAMHFGRPVITTDTGGLAEPIQSAGSGLVVPPDDPEALAGAICEFFDAGNRGVMESRAREAGDAADWGAFASFIGEHTLKPTD